MHRGTDALGHPCRGGRPVAEIFYGNCLALGIPCATASAAAVEEIQQRVMDAPHRSWSLDLEAERLTSEDQQWEIAVDEGPRPRC